MTEKTAYRKKKVIPAYGGIAIYLSVWLTLGIISLKNGFFPREMMGLWIASSLILLLGIWDDTCKVNYFIKFIFQIFSALILYCYGFRAEYFTHPFTGESVPLGFMSIFATVFWYLLIINAINLIDGLDGLATGVSAIAFWVLNALSHFGNVITGVLLGALIGFLPFNFFPARIFLGDTGSQLLGLLLAAMILLGSFKASVSIALSIPLSILMIPVINTLLIAIVRVGQGRNPFQSKGGFHLHYMLIRMGLTHRLTVLILYLVSLFFGYIALWMLRHASRPVSFWVTVASILLLAVVYFGIDRVRQRH
ncbi:MAG: hypothetical protein A3B72_10880 [Omnitrophica bacterium RIFCSPHIGHO2_02_FULL_45_28]|nr:MAG: hypothetical protein A3B72_10880 [Omnitrophica bacterium RIFCSPHIGHO2_02_FULL_45_28]